MTQASAILASAFATGLGSSLGPCVAPRYLMLGAVLVRGARPAAMAAFTCGAFSGYAAYGVAGSLLSFVQAETHTIYALTAAALIVAGVAALMQKDHTGCVGVSAPADSLGAMFLLGVSSAFTLSPCCTPIAVALGVQSAATGDPTFACAVLAVFAAGHLVPVFVLSAGTVHARRLATSPTVRWASSIVSAALLIALGSLYGLLA